MFQDSLRMDSFSFLATPAVKMLGNFISVLGKCCSLAKLTVGDILKFMLQIG